MKLTFEQFSQANEARKKQFFKDASAEWSISDAFMAATGEFGEIADSFIVVAALRHLGEMGNALKKVRRAELGMLNKNAEGRQINSLDEAKAKVAGEIGGFMCYLDQLCVQLGLRLEDCIVDEFNTKSKELNLPERIIDGKFMNATTGTFAVMSDNNVYREPDREIPVTVIDIPERVLKIHDEDLRSENSFTYRFGVPHEIDRLEILDIDREISAEVRVYNFDEPVQLSNGMTYIFGTDKNDQPFCRPLVKRPTVWTDGCALCRWCAMEPDCNPYCTNPEVKKAAGATVGIGLNSALQTCGADGFLRLFESRK